MKDYYEILGVEEDASDEEIRARWIELTKRFHPDLGGSEETDEKIREVNEAYDVLKNEVTRYHYDFERDLKRSLIKKNRRHKERRLNIRNRVLIPSAGFLTLFLIVGFFLFKRAEIGLPQRTGAVSAGNQGSEKKTALRTFSERPESKAREEAGVPREIEKEFVPPESKKEIVPEESKGRASLSPKKSPSAVERGSEQKKEPPRKILTESNVPASAPFPFPAKRESESKGKLAPQVPSKAEKPATKEVSREVRKETPKLVAQEIPKEVSKETPKRIAEEVPKEVPRGVPKEVPKEVPREAPQEVSGVSKEVPKEVSKEIPKEVSKEVPKEATKEILKEPPKEVAKEVPKEASKEVAKEIPREPRREAPKEIAKEIPKELPKGVSRVTLHPGEELTIQTKQEEAVSIRPPLLVKEEEVKEFFSTYVDRYNRKDLSGFLSLFSSKAVQNQRDGLGAIRTIYTKFMDQSEELRYQVEGVKIEIYQNRVEVKARFRVDQKLRKDREEKVWRGNVRWVLVKEEGQLKIISLDYQNEKAS